MMPKNSLIYVAGHTGLVGSALMRALHSQGYQNLFYRTIEELDLTRQELVEKMFREIRPEYVFLAAAKVGGILINNQKRAEFIYQNLMIEANIINSAYLTGVKKLLFLGSSCIYPRECPQPIREEYLLTGKLEPTNEPYALAKISGIKMCESYNIQYGTHFVSVMPTNLYGPYDNFNLTTSHVLPAMIRKFHEAKSDTKQGPVVLWGTGKPRREFLYVDDLADACLFVMNHYDQNEIINIGTGVDVTIHDLAEMIQKTTQYSGQVIWDSTKPDGTPQKLLDVSKLKSIGWTPRTTLQDGIAKTYQWYVKNIR